MRIELTEVLRFLDLILNQNVVEDQSKFLLTDLPNFLKSDYVYNQLFNVIYSNDYPVEYRLQSSILIKNNFINHYKNLNYICNDYKVEIRQSFLNFSFLLDNDAIADLVFKSFSKVVRFDYPRYWPDLLNNLLFILNENFNNDVQSLNSFNLLKLKRLFHLINYVVKELSTVKILTKASVMLDIINTLFNPILNVYKLTYDYLLHNLNIHLLLNNDLLDLLSINLNSFKILYKFSTYNFSRCDESEFIRTSAFVHLIIQHFPMLIQARLSLSADLSSVNYANDNVNKSLASLTSLLNGYSRLFKKLQLTQQKKFSQIDQIQSIIPILWSQIQSAGTSKQISNLPTSLYPNKLIINSILILKLCLADWIPNNYQLENKLAIINDDFAVEVTKFLLLNYIPLTIKDLELWNQDPEQFVNDDDLDQWEVDPRPCAENLIIGTLIKRRDVLSNLLIQFLNDAANLPPTTIDHIIYKESVYRIISKSCEYIRENIDFENVLSNTFIPEVQLDMIESKILRRRICSLLGKFAGENMEPQSYSKIYTIILHCLRPIQPINDVAVQITAAITLCDCVDTWEFDPNLLEPFLADIMPELIRILSACSVTEVKLKVIRSVTCIIEQVGERTINFADRLLELIPHLWDEAEGDWHFRGAILSMLAKLVASLQEGSNRALPLIVPLIQVSMDPSQGKPFIDGDGIELWQTTLKHAQIIDESLASLMPIAINTFPTDFDLANQLIPIIESYIYLAPEPILTQFSEQYFIAITSILDYATDSLRDQLINTLNLITIAGTPQSWAPSLNSTGLFRDLVKKLIENKESAVFLSKFIIFFSRILLIDSEMFLQLIRMSAASLNQSEEYVMESLLDRWWDKWDNLSHNYDRKLSASGLACLVSLGHEIVLRRLPTEIANIFIDVLAEVKERKVDCNQMPHFDKQIEDTLPSHIVNDIGDDGTAEQTRKFSIYSNDLVSTYRLPVFISHKIAQAQQNFNGGPDAFNSCYFMQADEAVLNQLISYMNEAM